MDDCVRELEIAYELMNHYNFRWKKTLKAKYLRKTIEQKARINELRMRKGVMNAFEIRPEVVKEQGEQKDTQKEKGQA